MQMGFFFDQTRCTGCYACVVACKDWHDIPAGSVNYRRVMILEKGEFPNVFVTFLATSCCHCEKPVCADACPELAITKREADGIVVVNEDKCLGKDKCNLCQQACPYDAPQFTEEPDSRMEKCNFCIDRLEESKEPICVASCPMRALDSGPLNELKVKYEDIQEAEGFEYIASLRPSIIFKPKENNS